MTGDGAGAIALHEHVRLAQQRGEPLALLVGAQVEEGRELAAAGVDVELGEARQVLSRDAHDVGAVGGERAPAHRAGDHAREVEHADAGRAGARPRAAAARRETRRCGVISMSGRPATAWPCGWEAHSAGERIMVATRPASAAAVSNFSASHLESAACTASRS